jgi:hypothetical protein
MAKYMPEAMNDMKIYEKILGNLPALFRFFIHFSIKTIHHCGNP